ncbi:alpha/beta fold hydrolase [Sphaerimonospora sp. CA-214678]|uniref:alpha/beta fold hydrolase n=1 Tax=Sphaerimonospora sp. CA-214678 TaxID=3240029 RepID=UPI003D8CBEA0
MPKPHPGMLPVPGARLYYEVRGSGPALLLISTGNGDATPYGPMADALADRYTVITYDRSGFSRSTLEGPVDDARRLEQEVGDAVHLLGHVAGGPAHVFGACSGAIVALALLTRHADRVRTLIAHEPPLASVLPDADRWSRFHTEVYEVYRRSGADAAKDMFKEHLGMATARPPKGSELPPDQLAELQARLRRNHLFWMEHEMRTYPDSVLDMAALESAAGKLILAGGRDSREHFPYRPNAVLAERLGTAVVDFPGGHLGCVTHPFEFARLIDGLIASAARGPA